MVTSQECKVACNGGCRERTQKFLSFAACEHVKNLLHVCIFFQAGSSMWPSRIAKTCENSCSISITSAFRVSSAKDSFC